MPLAPWMRVRRASFPPAHGKPSGMESPITVPSTSAPGDHVTKTIPNYLRIHRGADLTTHEPSESTLDAVNRFWLAFAETTGWRVDERACRLGESMAVLPVVSTETTPDIEAVALAPVSKTAAIELAESASLLADELQACREAMRRQEAELALRAPILTGQSDQTRVADRIETILADAAAACGCDAAAMYMLDDDTQHLTTRSVMGLSPQRLEEPPRQLRGSRGDLEAMVQGVVAVNDFLAGDVDTWNCPEPYAAGICAVIQSDDVPIGTLWMFRNDRAEFGAKETAAARMAASLLSLELSQLSSNGTKSPAPVDQPIRDVSQWQYETLPIGAMLADDWRVDGMIESPLCWATGWHSWDVLPDGTLMLSIAEAMDPSARGAMNAAIARAALAAHTGYRHTPAQLLQRISDTLWQTSTGEQLVSMLYARLDPETGEGEVASAGSITAIVGSRYGYRPLVDGQSDPLNQHIDARCATETFRMMKGETLLAYSQGMLANGASQLLLGEQLRSAMLSDDTNPLARIRRSLAKMPLAQERGAVTLLRR